MNSTRGAYGSKQTTGVSVCCGGEGGCASCCTTGAEWACFACGPALFAFFPASAASREIVFFFRLGTGYYTGLEKRDRLIELGEHFFLRAARRVVERNYAAVTSSNSSCNSLTQRIHGAQFDFGRNHPVRTLPHALVQSSDGAVGSVAVSVVAIIQAPASSPSQSEPLRVGAPALLLVSGKNQPPHQTL
jgi:hypothetical protein